MLCPSSLMYGASEALALGLGVPGSLLLHTCGLKKGNGGVALWNFIGLGTYKL